MSSQPNPNAIALPAELQTEIENINKADKNNAYRPLKLFAVINKDRLWITQQGSDEPLKKYEEMDVHIIAAKITRAAYTNREQKAPSCVSTDGGHTGTLHPEFGQLLEITGKDCDICPLNQWGTGKDENGNPTRGKFCKERRNLLAMSPDFTDPLIVSLSPMSIGKWDAYASGLTQLKPPSAYITQMTRIGVEVVTDAGREFGTATFAAIGALSTDAVRQAIELRKQYQNVIGGIVVAEPVATTAPTSEEELPF